jgi:hypothetical protein
LTYICNLKAQAGIRPASLWEDDAARFVINRLAELVVVLFNDHIGRDAGAMKDRADGRVVLLALGDVAADHGRADLTTILHDLAAKIQLEPPSRTTATFTYNF